MPSNFKVYKSSAGSGKTYTLVKEFLRLALKDDDTSRYRNILAITFTNKAANEMKARIFINLKKLASVKNSSNYDLNLMTDYVASFNLTEVIIRNRAKEVFESILHNYSDLKVSTIDKFTHKIIRAFAKDLSLQPDFEIEMDQNSILQHAIDSIISQAGEDEVLSKILITTLNKQVDEEKSWNIERNIFEFSKELTKEDNQEYFEQLKSINNDDFNEIKTIVSVTKANANKQIIDAAKNAVSLFENAGISLKDVPGGTTISFFKKISEEDFTHILEPQKRVLNAVDNDKWLNAKVSPLAEVGMESIKSDVTANYNTIINSASDFYLHKLIDDNIDYLVLVNEIYKAISLIKEENGILLISDFNKIISDQIKDQPAPFIYEKIGERYKNIMIDEFQDTSVLQWQNLLPLIDNSLAFSEANLIVGDAKQAIYRFRGGKVEQFVDLPNIFQHNDDALLLEREQALTYNYDENILPKNFRSHEQVIDFNNWFFNGMKQFLSEKNQTIYDLHEQIANPEKNKGLVDVTFIDHKDAEDLDEAYLETTLLKINEALADGFSLADISILVRNNKKSALLADYLVEQSIDVITSESLVIKDNPEVKFIINFLKYSANKQDNIAKLGILKYLTPQENTGETLISSSVSKNKYKKDIDIKTVLTKLNKVVSAILTLEISLYDLAEHIIREFNIDKKKANPYLICLLNKLVDFTSRSNNLNDFLSWWDEKGEKVSINTPENSNAISIMTIHKSKGLQFPVVISTFTNWAFKIGVANEWVHLDEPIGKLSATIIPLKKEIALTKYAYLLEEELNVNMLDNFNLLYVSLTRAEQRLYIISDTDIVTSKKEIKSNLISTYLMKVCNKHELYNTEINNLIIGERATKLREREEKNDNTYPLNTIISSNWRNKLEMSKLHKKHWSEGTYMEKIEYGNLIHDILSNIDTKDDIEHTLEEFANEGVIKSNQIDELTRDISTLLNKNPVNEWFSGKGIIKNEQGILTKEGEILRPDKVILFNNKTVVIDFKTGEKNSKYGKQIKQYGAVLQEMGYTNIEHYLLYTRYFEVEQVF
jgi:ATP-dependent exoDNAse (exonuclease V) beta subunit